MLATPWTRCGDIGDQPEVLVGCGGGCNDGRGGDGDGRGGGDGGGSGLEILFPS